MKKLIILLCLVSSFAYGQKISDLTAASTLGGTEVLAGVQSGNTRKISVNQIRTYVDASYWKVTGTTTLTGDVTIAGGSNALIFSGLDSLVFQQWNVNDTASYLLTMDPVTGKVERRQSSSITGSSSGGSVNTFAPNVQTGNYTIAATDTITVILMRSTGAQNLTIPVLTAGSTFTVVQDSTGTTTLVADTGVTLDNASGTLTLTQDEPCVIYYKTNSTAIVMKGGAASGGHVIEDEGTPVTQQTNMNFTGAGVSVADSGGKTVVTISGGSATVDMIDLDTVSTAGSTITLDFEDKDQKLFVGSASFSTPKTFALSNTDSARTFGFEFRITDLAAVITVPSDWVSGNKNLSGTTFTPVDTGRYELGGAFYGDYWQIKIIAVDRPATTIYTGTYTATLTNSANLDASTAYACGYERTDNMVKVFGRVDIDPTTTSTLTTLGFSLPIASDFTTANQAGGSGAASTVADGPVAILSDATNNRVTFQYICTSVANHAIYFTFTYQIL